MMDEFKLIDQVKEELCYVSTDILKEMKNSRNPKNYTRKNFHAIDPFGLPTKRSFVLPDFDKIHKGYLKPHDQPAYENEQVVPTLYLLYIQVYS